MHQTLRYALLAATSCCGLALPALAATPFVGHADAARPVDFDIYLPLRDTAALETLLVQQQDEKSPHFHQWLTPAEFGHRFGPGEAALGHAAALLRARGFTVTTQTRSLHVEGTAAAAEALLGTHLMLTATRSGATRVVRETPLTLPVELGELGARVYSFSPHEAHTLSHRVTALQPAGVENRESLVGPFWYNDLRQAYSYPSLQATVTIKGKPVKLDGTGATVGVLMWSDVYNSDIKAMFNHENWSKITGKADPVLYKRVAIGGGGGLDGDALGEASIDTQQALGGAPGSHVILYNIADPSDDNIQKGYTTIVEQNVLDAVSSSFGECELFYFPAYNNGHDDRGYLRTQHETFEQGNAQGITFLASSGDAAGLLCPTVPYLTGGTGTYVRSVSSPANDPDVTAVGGTNLVTASTTGSLNSAYVSENAWSDPLTAGDPYGTGGSVSGGYFGAGGGYSMMWPQPSWQAQVITGSTKLRAMPDIGMQVGGCPQGAITDSAGVCNGGGNVKDGNGNTQRSAVQVAVGVAEGGGFGGYVGTSVASPEFLSAVALLIETNGGRVGNLNPRIYAVAGGQAQGGPKFYHTAIPGFNGARTSRVSKSFSLSTGVGTPILNTFLSLTGVPVAGLPQTPSNP